MAKPILALAAFLTALGFPGRALTAEPEAAPPARLLVAAYFYPGGEGLKSWDKLIDSARQLSLTVIVNPDSGPGAKVNPNYAAVIERARRAKLRLLGYVSTRYAKKPLADVQGDADRWLRLYPGIEGFFFDEQASAADAIDYYAALYRHARKRRADALVVTNPGTVCVEVYLSRPAADVVCLFDNRADQLADYRPPAWASRYPAGRFGAFIHQVATSRKMKDCLREASQHRLGVLYVTDGGEPNPWDRLPSYWKEELAFVQQLGKR
jgi:hypothetical protein